VAGRKPAEQGKFQNNQKNEKRDIMTGSKSESSEIAKDLDFEKIPENHIRSTKTKRKQSHHLTVWDRRGERDKRLPGNFVEHKISCAQIRPRQKYAGRC
jgi:hypothetical protein